MERRGREREAHQSSAGALGVTLCLQTALQSDSRRTSSLGRQLNFGILLHPGHSQPPEGVRQKFGGSSSCHGPSVSRGSASTVLYLAGAFWGEGKEPAQDTLSTEIFWGGKASLKVEGAQEWFDSKIMELRAGFGVFWRGGEVFQ